ncbi:TPA: site-specific integrase [Streptococcus pneumoniae]|nr:site-specific integrase [Streptococcus pneumoniae]
MQIKQITKKDGSIVYRANVYLGVDKVTGKDVKTSITGRTKKEVKQKTKEAEIAFLQNGSTRFQASNITTYKELASLWWESYKHTVKPNTQLNVRRLLDNHILPLFGSYKLDKLTTPLIQNIVNKLADKTNKGEEGAFLYYDSLHALNKRILQYGVVMQAIPFNPAREVILPRNTQKAKREKVKHFDNDELKSFLKYLDTLDLSRYRYYYEITLYKFLLATGCRIGEALALEWSDIDLKKGTISISKTLNRYQETNTPKSKAGLREIDIDKATVFLLKQYKKRQQVQSWQLGRSEGIVFTPFTTKYAYACLLRKRLQSHFKAAGVPDISFHGFRHTHATIMLYAGIEAKDLQYRLGHSNISMTLNTYVHATKEGAKKAVSIFEAAISNL